MGYRDTVLVEVADLPTIQDGVWKPAVERLREAREEYIAGRYRQVVVSCRLALEAVGKATGDGHGSIRDLRSAIEHKESMTKEERMLAAHHVLFFSACLAPHHKDEVTIQTSWNRHDAEAMLTMTAGLLQWYLEARRG
jgi:hypothetical protein